MGPRTHQAGSKKRNDGDSRLSKRWHHDLVCRYRWEEGIFDGRLLDISMGGAFIESPEPPPEAASVILALPSPAKGEGVVFVSGLVRHQGRYLNQDQNFRGFGVEFQRVSTPVVRRIQQLIGDSTLPAPRKYPMI